MHTARKLPSRSPPATKPHSGGQKVLVAASELFNKQGTRATGIDSIIEHAGVAKATFYAAFKSKDVLILAWLDRTETRWHNRAIAYAEGRSSGGEGRIAGFFDFLNIWFAEDQFNGCPYINTALEFPDEAYPARKALRGVASSVQDFFAENARTAGLDGAKTLAGQLLLLVQGAIVSASTSGGPPNPALVARKAAKKLIEAARRG